MAISPAPPDDNAPRLTHEGVAFADTVAAGLAEFGRQLTDAFRADAFITGADLDRLDDGALAARLTLALAVQGAIEVAVRHDDYRIARLASADATRVRRHVAAIRRERRRRRQRGAA